MNFSFRNTNQPARLQKKVTLKSFLEDNPMWSLTIGILIGSLAVVLLVLILFYSLAPATIQGVI